MIIYYRYHTLQRVIGITLYMIKAKKVTCILDNVENGMILSPEGPNFEG